MRNTIHDASPENQEITVRTHDPLARLAGLRGVTRDFDLDNCALVAIDLQRLFTDSGSPLYLQSWSEAEPVALQLLQAFYDSRRPIVFTRHRHSPADRPHLLGHFFNSLLEANDPLAALHPIAERFLDRAVYFEKNTHAAFAHALPDALQSVKQVVLIGVQTPLCVAATAIDLARYGILPVVAADACAAADADQHLAALTTLATGHAMIARGTRVLKHLQNNRRMGG